MMDLSELQAGLEEGEEEEDDDLDTAIREAKEAANRASSINETPREGVGRGVGGETPKEVGGGTASAAGKNPFSPDGVEEEEDFDLL